MSLISRLFIPAIMKRCKQTYNNVFSDLSINRYYSDSLDDKACSERNRKQQKIICNDEWRKRLSPDEYYVTREKGTEPPFSGKYYNHCEEGVYKCICCSSDLFSSAEKYESHCGWPSFYSPILTKLQDGQSPVKTKLDTNHGMVRTEVLCGECDAHLGHVFDDGPKPTGLRYCINSVALKFTPKKG